MKHSCLSLLAVIGLTGVLLTPVTKADPLYKRTEVTFNQPVEIPGMVLVPGTYVLKRLDPYLHHGDYVRFYNPQENHMYAMVRAIPDYRLTPTNHTVITFEERAHGAPQAIKEWFPAGDNWGAEFVYPKAETVAGIGPASELRNHSSPGPPRLPQLQLRFPRPSR